MDFSALTDDQLMELIRAALIEAAQRGNATSAAAQSIYLDQAERAQIERAAYDREAAKALAEERIRAAKEAAEKARVDIEARKKAAGAPDSPKPESEQEAKARKIRERFEYEEKTLAEFKSILGPLAGKKDWWIEVWLRHGEKRVYAGTRGVEFGKNEIDYYQTGRLSGREKKKPGTLECERGFLQTLRDSGRKEELFEQLKAFFETLCSKFHSTLIGEK